MPDDFIDRWRRKERESGRERIAAKMIQHGSDSLPDSAAPGVSFEQFAKPLPIWEVFGVPSDWSATDRERLAEYRMIGSDGAGNPICLAGDLGAVVLLDHEDGFRTRQFVNSSAAQLGECLLARMGASDAALLQAAIQVIDPAALAEGSFWWHEVACLEYEE